MYDKYVDINTGVMDSEAQSKQIPDDHPFLVKGEKFSVLQYTSEDASAPHGSKETLLTLENSKPTELKIQEVLQACQNYDYRHQRELLRSGVTLSLQHSEEYLVDQAIREEDAAFRLACAKYMRSNYQARPPRPPAPPGGGARYQESEEQASARRAQNAMRMRHYRQGLRALESEEQAAERRAQNALRMRNYRRFKRELEPEAAAERRAQNAQRMRHYRKAKRELEPEISALRRAQNALRMRNYRKSKRQHE